MKGAGLEEELAWLAKVMTGSCVQGLVDKGLAVGCPGGVSRRETAVSLLSFPKLFIAELGEGWACAFCGYIQEDKN